MARILLIDDEESVRSYIRGALESRGHEVREAVDGVDGVAEYRRVPTDLVIVDILMPRMGGLNLIREVRELDPEVPIISISGGGKDGRLNFLSTARTFPGVWTLKKPFRLAQLRDLVTSCLGDTTDREAV